MNRFLEGALLAFVSLLSIVVFFIIIIGMSITLNNEDEAQECGKMRDYGYASFIKVTDRPLIDVKTCWIMMEDGRDIRSSDYSIADHRKPRMVIHSGGKR